MQLVSTYVELRKAGGSYKGLSPFNNEKTASFFVDPEKQVFHCFSSGKGGDCFDFIQIMKGLSFAESIVFLAERANIPVPRQTGRVGASRDQDVAKKMLKLNQYAAHFYSVKLEDKKLGKRAFDYLINRQVDVETQKKFHIGFAPDSWNSLRDYLISVKAPLDLAVTLGLLKVKKDQKPMKDGSNLFDAFRNRIMFPIKNIHGDVIAFGGRTLDKDGQVKYLNSPESPVFNKGRVLYNFDQARKSVRDNEIAIVVEGYMDCVALDRVGINNVCAPLGTGFTENHAALLLRAASKVVVLFDGDEAGQTASLRIMDLFLDKAGFPVQGIILPKGQDPDDFLRDNPESGPQEMQKLIQRAPALVDTWIDSILRKTAPTLQSRAEALEKIAEKLSKLQDSLFIRARIPHLVNRLQLDEVTVAQGLLSKSSESHRNVKGNRKSGDQKNQQKPIQNDRRNSNFELKFLFNTIHYLDWLPALKKEYDAKQDDFYSLFVETDVVEVMKKLLSAESLQAVISNLLEEYRANSLIRGVLLKASINQIEVSPEGYLEDALSRLRKRNIDKKRKELLNEIAIAEFDKDFAKCETLQNELQLLIRQESI